jgi:hypothetical protein
MIIWNVLLEMLGPIGMCCWKCEEQLAQFRQAHEVGNSSQQSSVPDPNVEPFPSYGEDGGEQGGEETDSDDEE